MNGDLTNIARWALIAQGAYALFDESPTPEQALTEAGSGDFAESEANRLLDAPSFAHGFVLLNDQPNEPTTGFSASVFLDRLTNKFVLGIRGTENFPDVIEDFNRIGFQGFAGDQLVSLYRYYKRLTTTAGQSVQYSDSEVSMLQTIRLGIGTGVTSLVFNAARTAGLREQLSLDVGLPVTVGSGPSVLPPGAPLIVTGHSLGGHLALLFGRFFPEVTEHVYTYNAPGIGPHGEIMLRAMGIPPLLPSVVTNVSAVMGSESISKIWSKPGENIGVATEPGGPIHEHSIVPLTDTLALYDAFAKLSPGLASDVGTVSGIISAASPFPESSLEIVLDQLGELLATGRPPTPIARLGSDLAAREGYYQNLYAVLDSRVPGLDYEIETLVGRTVDQLASAAATDVSVLYALHEMMPFHAGNADYSEFDESAFSDAWIVSRAEMLEGILKNNLSDRPFGTTGSADSIVYRDVTSGACFSLLDESQYQVFELLRKSPLVDRQGLLDQIHSATYKRSVVFGSNSISEGDLLFGLPGGDRLFGDAGDDYLEGESGDDYLEGGTGDDVLFGGEGDDTLDCSPGSDHLEGGAGIDTYLFESELDADTIIDRDGEIYAGTTRLTGGIREDDGAYLSSDGLFSYEFSGDLETGGTLLINGKLRIEDFRNENLGIRLFDDFEPAEWNFETDAELFGDFEYGSVEISPGQFVSWDSYGNPIARGAYVPDLPDFNLAFPGTPGNTHFVMGGGDDAIQDVYGGDDHIDLGTGNDVGFGGRGDDLIEGGPGLDIVAGGRGNDFLYAGSVATADADLDDGAVGTSANGGDLLSGGDGDDTIVGNAEVNPIEGGLGDDRIFGGAGDDWIGGDTAVLASAERYQVNVVYHDYSIERFGDFLWTDTDPPRLFFDSYFAGYSLIGGIPFGGIVVEDPADGADSIDAGAGNDTIYAGGGDDVIFGGTGNDFIRFGTGADVVFGGDGNDTVYFASSGSGVSQDAQGDYIDGGEGDDTIGSAAGDDSLVGGTGNDFLSSGTGNDLLWGGAGNDILFASGNAVLDGGSGSDLLTCASIANQEVQFRMGRGSGADVAIGTGGTMIVEAVDLAPGEVTIAATEQEIVVPGFGSIGIVPGVRIDVGEGGDSLFLLGWHQPNELVDRRIEFSDGTIWDDAFIQSILDAPGPTAGEVPVFAGSGDGDLIYGTAGADTFFGGAGNDWLLGDSGGDVYLYAGGDGFDTIEDLDPASGNSDVVRFAGGILPEDVDIYAIGSDYVLTAGDGGLRLRGGRTPEGEIERVEFSSNDVWLPADLESRAELLPDNRAPEMPLSFGSVSVDPGHRVEVVLPQDAISDPDRFDSISLYAIAADGERLPGWLQFDASSRTLAGTPSAQDAGLHEFLVIAADTNGAAALGSLTIDVGREAPGDVAPVVLEQAQMTVAPVAAPALVVGGDAPVFSTVSAPQRREDAFSIADDAPPASVQPPVIADAADPAFREIQHSTDVLLQTGRVNLGERYAEAIREFEERRRQREESQEPPLPTDEEVEAWNAAMHSWHDRNPGFAESELGGNDGTWSMGWGLPGPGERALADNLPSSQPGLANPNALARFRGAASAPSLSEGFRDLR